MKKIMYCEDCGKEVDVCISIKIVIEKDYREVDTLHTITFCLDCFRKTNEGTYFDERIDLNAIIEEAKKI